MEKIQVAKVDGLYTYTGNLIDREDGWVEINTSKDGLLVFRKEQIMQRNILN